MKERIEHQILLPQTELGEFDSSANLEELRTRVLHLVEDLQIVVRMRLRGLHRNAESFAIDARFRIERILIVAFDLLFILVITRVALATHRVRCDNLEVKRVEVERHAKEVIAVAVLDDAADSKVKSIVEEDASVFAYCSM